MILTTFKN